MAFGVEICTLIVQDGTTNEDDLSLSNRRAESEGEHEHHERGQIDHAQNNRMGCSGLWSVYRHFSRWPNFA